MLILLDSGVVGSIINPKRNAITNETRWLTYIKDNEIHIKIPIIIDYEIRRNLVLENLFSAIKNLDQFSQRKQILPLSNYDYIIAAELWAKARQQGLPTADNNKIDIDIILVAQAISQIESYQQVVITTTDPKDIKNLCTCFGAKELEVWDWKQALNDCIYDEINYYSPISTI